VSRVSSDQGESREIRESGKSQEILPSGEYQGKSGDSVKNSRKK